MNTNKHRQIIQSVLIRSIFVICVPVSAFAPLLRCLRREKYFATHYHIITFSHYPILHYSLFTSTFHAVPLGVIKRSPRFPSSF